jgi:hypothetical protein
MSHPFIVNKDRHPWFYVPGRKDLTEKRISRKHERESRSRQEWDQHNKYFKNCSAHVKLLNDWQHRSPKPLCSIPPFDCDLDAFKKRNLDSTEIDQRFVEVADELKSAIESVNQTEKKALELKDYSESLLSCFDGVRQIKVHLQDQMESMNGKWRKIFHTKVTRDRLMHLTFLVLERLECFSESLVLLKACLYDFDVFDETDQNELESVLDPTETIMRNMTALNNNRLSEFSSSYNEEAEKMEDDVISEWKDEDDMCLQVLEEIRETVESAVLEKMQLNSQDQRNLLETRNSALSNLESLVTDLKSDNHLWQLISTRFTSFQSFNL